MVYPFGSIFDDKANTALGMAGQGKRLVDLPEVSTYFLDELRNRTAVIGTSNEATETLSDRFKSRFQLVKVPSPDQSAIRAWLVDKWKVAETAADWISISCCGNVREALLQAASYVQFGVLPEKEAKATRLKAKCSNHVEMAKQYWADVRAGIRPAPGSKTA